MKIGQRKAFTMMEALFAVVFVLIAVYAAASAVEAMMKTSVRSDMDQIRDVYDLEDDVAFSGYLSKSVSIGNGSLSFSRYDGCTIEYYLSDREKKIRKRANCPDNADPGKAVVVGNVESFDVNDNGDGTYTMIVKKAYPKTEYRIVFGILGE